MLKRSDSFKYYTLILCFFPRSLADFPSIRAPFLMRQTPHLTINDASQLIVTFSLCAFVPAPVTLMLTISFFRFHCYAFSNFSRRSFCCEMFRMMIVIVEILFHPLVVCSPITYTHYDR